MELELSDQELERYGRQLVVPEFGIDAQLKLKQASVLVVGAGALGTQAAGYLAAAGVGRIGIVDDDKVELSNLQRQLLHFPPDIGYGKAESIAEKLSVLNPEILIEPFPARVEVANADALIAGRDVVVDCSDNFETRYILNEVSVTARCPLVEAGVSGGVGLLITIVPGSACYHCAFGEQGDGLDEGCEETGVIGPVAGVIGAAQAMEALKAVTGVGELMTDKVFQYDGIEASVSTVKCERDPSCPVCGS